MQESYSTQYTSRMGTSRVKQEVGADKNRKSSKQCLTRAKDLPVELPKGRESPYHGLD